MWGKDKKTIYFDFLPYECKAAEEYLENMAEKGWLLQSIKGAFLKFKKIEPRKIKYSVDVLHKISGLQHKGSDIALELREFYQAAGWNYVCQKEDFQVFYTENYENNIPIHNEREEFKSLFKASLSRIISPLIWALLFIFNLHKQLFVGSIDFTLATNIGILSVFVLVFLIFINTGLIISFFIWTIKSWILLRKNKSMAYKSCRQVRSKNGFISLFWILLMLALIQTLIFNNRYSQIFGISILLIMLVASIPILFVRIFINKKSYSKNTNLAIYTVSFIAAILLLVGLFRVMVFKDIALFEQNEVSAENTILTLKDFEKYQNNNESSYIKIDKSILAKRINYSWGNSKDTLNYTCFESQYPWLLKFDENRVISNLDKYGFDLKQIDSKLPSNIKVYKGNYNRSFVLVSEDRVVDIKKGFDYIEDEEFLSIVYGKLFKD